jgi:hypothetical protein
VPLKKGNSKAAKASNYKKLKKEGCPPRQQVAIMLKEAGVGRGGKRPKGRSKK